MTKQNIYIPFDRFTETGGPATFMRNLRDYLDLKKFSYTLEPDDAGNIFFPILFDLDILDRIKANHGKIIQRLDGIYYPQKHGDEYIELNSHIKEIYLNYSDFVIFQSEYSRQQCFELLGPKDESEYTIILNGVNTDIFYPANEELKPGDKIKFVTSGRFRNIDMIAPVTEALDILKNEIDFELTVVGPVTNPELQQYFDRDYIVMAGEKNMQEVAALLRQCHIFIYSHLNPPCPNSVLEAIASGLPIVGFDSGSMKELLPFSKGLLAEASNDIFQKYEDFDSKKLSEKLMLCVNNYTKFKESAVYSSKNNSFEKCGDAYISVFRQLNPKQGIFSKFGRIFKGGTQ